MKCEAARFILDQYLEAQLNPVQKEKLEEHLNTCPACTREVSHLRGYRKLLGTYFDAVRGPAGFAAEVLVRLDKPASGVRKRPPTEVGPVLVEPPRRRSPVRRLLGGIAVLAAIGLAAFWMVPRRANEPVAAARETQGSAEARLPGASQWEPVRVDQKLPTPSTVRTGKPGSLRIEFPDKTTAELFESTELELQEASPRSGITLALRGGHVLFNVISGEDRFRVVTDLGETVVRRAERYVTQFELHVSPAGAGGGGMGKVETKTGEVTVTNSSGSQAVASGMQSILRSGQPPSVPSPIVEAATRAPSASRTPERKPPTPTPSVPERKPPTAGGPGQPPVPPQSPVETLDSVVASAIDASLDDDKRLRAIERIVPLARSEEERAAARSTLRELMRRGSTEKIRSAAIHALSSLKDEELFPELVDAFRNDPAADVRRAAMTAMVGLKREDAHGPLVEALSQGNALPEDLRVDVVKAIAGFKSPEDVPTLAAVLRGDESLRVREEAATALGSIRDKESVTALIEALRDSDPSLRAKSAQALRILTGQAVEFNASGTDDEREAGVRRWEEWWAENRDSFQ